MGPENDDERRDDDEEREEPALPADGEIDADDSEDEEGEGSDEYDSEDDDSGDEDDDEEEDDFEDADEVAASVAVAAVAEPATAAPSRMRKTGRKKRAPKSTAGQRLAAAKAAKAARKAAERGRDTDQVEDKATQQAEAVGNMLEQNRQRLLMAIVAVLVVAAGYFTWDYFQRGAAAEASAALWDAVRTANAPIVPDEEDTADEDDDSERYPTFAARAEAALEEFRAVQAEYGDSQAAIFAALGEGSALYDTGDFAGARGAYERALADGGDDVLVAARAIEGIGFTHEAEDDWDAAQERYQELGTLGTAQADALSGLHLARVALQAGDEDAAKEKLQALLESLREEEAAELPYVQDQAELRLMAIDSSLVQRRAPDLGGLGGLEDLGGGGGRSQEELQRMIQELMQKQGAAGGGLGGPPGAPPGGPQ